MTRKMAKYDTNNTLLLATRPISLSSVLNNVTFDNYFYRF